MNVTKILCIGKILVLLISMFILSGFEGTLAATYYISNSGCDNNDGTSETRPWKTLGKINATLLLPGDVVKLKCGDTWWGQLVLSASGTTDKPILITHYGSGLNPRIYAGGKILSPIVWILDTTTYVGKVFYKCQVNPLRVIYGLWSYKSGQLSENYVFKGGNPQNCVGKNDFVYDKGWVWVLSESPLGASEDNCVVYGDYYNGILIEQKDYIIIDGIDVFCTTYGGKGYHGGIGVTGMREKYAKGIIIKNCSSSYNSYLGIGAVYVDGLILESCTTQYNQRAGGIYISQGSSDVKILSCESSYNGRYPNVKGSDRGGISIGGSGNWHENALIEECVSHHNGLWAGGYVDGGIHFFHVKGGTVRRCKSYNNGGAGIMINGTGNYEPDEDCTIDGCLVYNNGLLPTSMYTGGIVCFRPAIVTNNIIASNNLEATSSYAHSGIFFSMHEGAYSCEVENNIMYNNALAANRYELFIGPSFTQIHANHNCYYNNQKDEIIFYGLLGAMNWNRYHVHKGLEPASIFADPMFLDPSSGNFTFKSRSPCIGWQTHEPLPPLQDFGL